MSVIGFVDSVGRDLRHALRTLAAAARLHVCRGAHARAGHWREHGDLQRRLLGADQAAAVSECRRARADQAQRHAASTSPSELAIRADDVLHVPRREPDVRRRSACGGTAAADADAASDEPERVRALARHARRASGARRAADARTLVHGSRARRPPPKAPTRSILSYAFWQRRFGGDEAALGRELSIDGAAGAKSSASCRAISASST